VIDYERRLFVGSVIILFLLSALLVFLFSIRLPYENEESDGPELESVEEIIDIALEGTYEEEPETAPLISFDAKLARTIDKEYGRLNTQTTETEPEVFEEPEVTVYYYEEPVQYKAPEPYYPVIIEEYNEPEPESVEEEIIPEEEITVADDADIKEPEEATQTYFTEEDVIACAKMLWGEARGCDVDDMENCVRTVCNRADDSRYPSSISDCVTQPYQYSGYSSSNPVSDELYNVAYEILSDWAAMKDGEDVEWYDYNSFYGNGDYNTFYRN